MVTSGRWRKSARCITSPANVFARSKRRHCASCVTRHACGTCRASWRRTKKRRLKGPSFLFSRPELFGVLAFFHALKLPRGITPFANCLIPVTKGVFEVLKKNPYEKDHCTHIIYNAPLGTLCCYLV